MTNACNAQTQPRESGTIFSLGELLVDLIPVEDGGRIEKTGAVLKVASGSAGIFACAVAALGASSGFLGKVVVKRHGPMVAARFAGPGAACADRPREGSGTSAEPCRMYLSVGHTQAITKARPGRLSTHSFPRFS